MQEAIDEKEQLDLSKCATLDELLKKFAVSTHQRLTRARVFAIRMNVLSVRKVRPFNRLR